MKTKRMTQFEDKLIEMIKSHKEYLNVFVTEYDNLKPTVQDYIQGLYVTKLLCNTVFICSGYDTAYARFVLKYALEKMTQFVYIAQKSTSYRVYLAQLEELGALAHLVGTTNMNLICSVLQGDRLQQAIPACKTVSQGITRQQVAWKKLLCKICGFKPPKV